MELLPPGVEDYVAMKGDSLFSLNLRKMLAMHEQNDALITVAGYETRNPYGVLSLNQEGNVINFTEKPKFIGSTGMYVLSRDIQPYLPEHGSIEHDTFPQIPEDRFFAYTDVDYFFNINSPHELEEGKQAVASGLVTT
jgi:NDP-sugar pyrophosphorylase family protein